MATSIPDSATLDTTRHPSGEHKPLAALSFAALGIVFGDIGTSPLYALRECFYGIEHIAPVAGNVFGILSLIVWALIIVVSVKYLSFILRADNRGEGGILALLALVDPWNQKNPILARTLLSLGFAGAALLYGDCVITPAISVLSAVEGIESTALDIHHFVLPISVAVLLGVFMLQRHGTEKIAVIFSPVLLAWFVALAVLGIRGILLAPEVLLALNPLYAIRFCVEHRDIAVLALGAVFLAVTGGEALYADMGHFGRRAIQRAWFVVVLPALLLNYFGQGALILTQPTQTSHPLYDLTPSAIRLPMIVLATAAAVIASQAVISGAFSMTRQAIQLKLWPPSHVIQTSPHEFGQIYIPSSNWLLMIFTIGVVLAFGSSSRLAGAYGVAVNLTMVVTTLLAYFFTRHCWHWPAWRSALVVGLLLVADIVFLVPNSLKIPHGGWFPLLIGAGICIVMSTWAHGRDLLKHRRELSSVPVATFFQRLERERPLRAPGTAVFLSSTHTAVPAIVVHHLDRNRVLHEKLVLLTALTENIPYVLAAERFEVEPLGSSAWRVLLHYGFMENAQIPRDLRLCLEKNALRDIDEAQATYYVGRTVMIPTEHIPGMALWRERLFAFLTRNAMNAAAFYSIPTERLVELGIHIEI